MSKKFISLVPIEVISSRFLMIRGERIMQKKSQNLQE